MDVKEAIVKAKDYIRETFADEKLRDLGLEEVDYDDNQNVWYITIGFSRPWDSPRTSASALMFNLSRAETEPPARRSYKLVTISDDGKKISVRNREVG